MNTAFRPGFAYTPAMTADQYLWNILTREAVDNGPASPVRGVATVLAPIITRWGNGMLNRVTPSGSFSKGTANKTGTDIDLFLSVSSATTNTLKEIYESLFATMQSNGYSPKKQNVSINIRVNGYDVDLVPGKQQDLYSQDHSLYRRRADTWTKTNVQTHIKHVIGSGRTSEARIIKLWRNQHGIDFPSFYLEMSVIESLKSTNLGLSGNVWEVFKYLRDSFTNGRVVDPANTNNIVSDDLTGEGKAKVKAAAVTALAAANWNQIVT